MPTYKQRGHTKSHDRFVPAMANHISGSKSTFRSLLLSQTSCSLALALSLPAPKRTNITDVVSSKEDAASYLPQLH